MQTYELQARKIGTRAIKLYRTTIDLDGNRCKVSNHIKKNVSKISEFERSEIEGVQYGLTPIINTIDIVRFIIAAAMLVFPPVGLLAFAFFFYYTLIKTAKIKLKTGKTIKLYYEKKEDAVAIVERMTDLQVV